MGLALTYEVHFVGIEDPSCLKALKDASELIFLQNRPPASVNGLRFRISSDLPELLRVLRAYAFYEALITSKIEKSDQDTYQVYLLIQSGPQYTLSSYEVYHGDCKELASVKQCPPLTPKLLGLEIGKPALSVEIVNGELNILTELAKCGHPLAYVDKRRVVVDMATKSVEAASCIQEGPLSKFGESTFFGLKGIKPEFVQSKISWREGEIYSLDLIQKTQERLLKTELFSSVYVTHAEELDPEGELPMKLRFSEAKHQKISLGLYYGTVDGPGGTLAWSHRNIGGMGDILSIKADASKRWIAGNITYKKPDFLTIDQTYRALAEISRENILAYLSLIYRAANYLERRMTEKTNFSAGMKIEDIHVMNSASNGTYLLLGAPLFVFYDGSNNLLDATQGFTIAYSITPFQSFFHSNEHFIKQRLTTNFYIPLGTQNFVLALRAQLGSIAGAKQPNIPLTKLFLGGSEDDLRGYRYKTVSPLNASNQPLGGRSAVYTSIELRWKVTKTIGLVPFADFGTVASSQLPNFSTKWFKSVGGGFRYFTFFGPLRVDVGFPLDKRQGIDHNLQVYASVGQAF